MNGNWEVIMQCQSEKASGLDVLERSPYYRGLPQYLPRILCGLFATLNPKP